jgi:hypothetical protein
MNGDSPEYAAQRTHNSSSNDAPSMINRNYSCRLMLLPTRNLSFNSSQKHYVATAHVMRNALVPVTITRATRATTSSGAATGSSSCTMQSDGRAMTSFMLQLQLDVLLRTTRLLQCHLRLLQCHVRVVQSDVKLLQSPLEVLQ